MQFALYNIGIWLYGFGIWLVSPFVRKAKLWCDGRKNWIQQHRSKQFDTRPIWIHCSSLGEFESGRPVIEQLKHNHPDIPILLTFFSPSGYQYRKDYSFADHVTYLPLDRPANAKTFMAIWNPRLAIFVKYDLWINHLRQLQDQYIPTIVISAIFRSTDFYFRWYGRPFLRILRNLTHFFVQDEHSRSILNEYQIEGNVSVVGDTRLDRVLQIVHKKKDIRKVKEFCDKKRTIVAGSTWPEDERVLFSWIEQYDTSEFDKLVLVPHEIYPSRIRTIEELAPRQTVRLSKYQPEDQDKIILIVDQMGILNKLYRYARLAYIGGGFGAGIHNILEAAAYRIPVIFGPKYQKFNEAHSLLRMDVARTIQNSVDLQESVHFLLKKQERGWIEKQMDDYFRTSSGATKSIIEYIQTLLDNSASS